MQRYILLAISLFLVHSAFGQTAYGDTDAEKWAKMHGSISGMASVCGGPASDYWLGASAKVLSEASINSNDVKSARKLKDDYELIASAQQRTQPQMNCADVSRLLGDFERFFLGAAPPKMVKIAPQLTPGAPLHGPVVVFFDFNKADLASETKTILTTVLREAKLAKFTKIFASGHADRSGKREYSDKLADLRVDVVMRYFIESGIPKAMISTAGHGEDQPTVMTLDDHAEQKNRRVEIRFSR